MKGMWRENRDLNLEIVQAKELLEKNPMVIMRDKYTKMPLAVSFSEEGLRGKANKMGVYQYCQGRVTNFNEARTAKKNPNVIVERFIPRNYPDNPKMETAEILWINNAKKLLTYND